MAELHRLMQIPGVGPKRAEGLENSGIRTMQDLLFYFPSRYIFRDTIRRLENVEDRQMVTTVVHVQKVSYNMPKRLLTLHCVDGDADGPGDTDLRIFMRGPRGMGLSYPPGTMLLIWDIVRRDGNNIWFFQPPMEKIGDEEQIKDLSESFKFYPVYPGREKLRQNGISEKIMLKTVRGGLELDGKRLRDPIPGDVLTSRGLPVLTDAVKMLHLPTKPEDIELARERFVFQDHLEKQAIFQMRRQQAHLGEAPALQPGVLTRALMDWSGFTMTNGQKKAWMDIVSDIHGGKRMTRLLQGDTGSGKTHIAMLAAMAALDTGLQAAFMIPNVVLAHQHFEKYTPFFDKAGVMACLLTGDIPERRKEHNLRNLMTGGYRFVVGTQALLSGRVGFRELGVAIIDEQHRFGVGQRMKFLSKEPATHYLQMSATPIPRTVALTEYGDMDITTMRGFPGNRAGYRTFVRTPDARDKLYDFIDEKLKKGEQGFVVYPVIKESETLDLESAERGFEKMCKRFGTERVRYLHGRMSGEDKMRIFKSFREGEFPLLVSTQVIEVGVDVPNATIMVIEDADSFGLAQLHQLRGRVGRAEHEGFCVLITRSEPGSERYERLTQLAEMTDGFDIAEYDLQTRGSGRLLGTMQSGHLEHIDPGVFERAGEAAKEIIARHDRRFIEYMKDKYGFRGHIDVDFTGSVAE